MNLASVPVVIMAGGLGTRIRDKVKDVPKPMIPFGGNPFLHYKIVQLQRAGFQEIILTIGFMGDQIRDYFKDGSQYGLNISYSVEKNPLGTGGGLKQCEPLLGTPFFMVNGDTFYLLDWQAMADYYTVSGSKYLMMLTDPLNPGQEGSVVQDSSGFITDFQEKTPHFQGKKINGGVYLLHPEIFRKIPPGKSSIEKEVFPALARERSVKGYYYRGYFIDIGTPEFYEKFQRDVERGQIPL